jgi:hypothetical protein
MNGDMLVSFLHEIADEFVSRLTDRHIAHMWALPEKVLAKS